MPVVPGLMNGVRPIRPGRGTHLGQQTQFDEVDPTLRVKLGYLQWLCVFSVAILLRKTNLDRFPGMEIGV